MTVRTIIPTHFSLRVLRLVAQGMLGTLFLFTTAGIPMITYFCGGDGSTLVCPMGACEQEQHEGLAIGSPDCCTPVVQQSDLDNGLLAHAVDLSGVHPHTVSNVVNAVHNQTSECFDASIQVHSPPLRILVHSFLI